MTSRKSVLEIINNNSLVLYCLLKDKKIKTKALYEAIQTRNKDLILEKKLSISKTKIKELENNYPKEKCLDETLFLTNKKYKHLREIRYIVNMNEVINKVITDKIYQEKLKAHYTDLIIDLLIADFYDYQSLKKFCNMREKLIKLDSDINHKIINNIDKYYIEKITI